MTVLKVLVSLVVLAGVAFTVNTIVQAVRERRSNGDGAGSRGGATA